MNIETKLAVTQTISNHCSCIFLGFPVAYQMIVCFDGGKESTTCSISVPASEDVLDIIICPYLVILGQFPASSDTNLRPATAATRLKAVAAPSDTISVTAAWRHWRGSRNGAPPSGIFQGSSLCRLLKDMAMLFFFHGLPHFGTNVWTHIRTNGEWGAGGPTNW